MKIQTILQESIGDILDTIDAQCETNKPQCAKHLATIMVMRDMGKQLRDENHELQKNTYIDFLFGSVESAQKALSHFYNRIQENPRARRLLKHYETQFLDYSYGHTVMRNRIESLRPYFNQRKLDRIKYHEDTVVSNLRQAQAKIASEYKDQYDLSDGDKIHDEQAQASQRHSGR